MKPLNLMIIGQRGAGKTVMLTCLAKRYSCDNPDVHHCFLQCTDPGTQGVVDASWHKMRSGEWPEATATGSNLKNRDGFWGKLGDKLFGRSLVELNFAIREYKTTLGFHNPKKREVKPWAFPISLSDFSGEAFSAAYGKVSGDKTLREERKALLRKVAKSDCLMVLVNLEDYIQGGDETSETHKNHDVMRRVLKTLLKLYKRKQENLLIVLSQADKYEHVIKACGDAREALDKYVSKGAKALLRNYPDVEVLAVSAMETDLNEEGNLVPAKDFTSDGLERLWLWMKAMALQKL